MTKQEALQELMDLSIDYGTRTADEIERLDEAVDMAIKALKVDALERQTCEDAVSRAAAIAAVSNWLYDRDDGRSVDQLLSTLPSAQPKRTEKRTETHACDLISRQAAIDELDKGAWGAEWDKALAQAMIESLPSAQPQTEWNNHTVACLLAELFGDACACNFNGIDEWLPEKCEVIDACPNPVGVACWEQFLKHRAERRTDE